MCHRDSVSTAGPDVGPDRETSIKNVIDFSLECKHLEQLLAIFELFTTTVPIQFSKRDSDEWTATKSIVRQPF